MKHLDTLDKIVVLQQEIVELRSRLREHATGHIHTAIGVLQQRIGELDAQRIEEQRVRNR